MERNVLGYVDFDERVDVNGSSCVIIVPEDRIDKLHRGKYVKIISQEGRVFVGRIKNGPFFKPESLSPTSYIAKTFIVKGDTFKNPPPYYALFIVEILGELERGRLLATYTRPKPKSPVYEMRSIEVSEFMGLGGDMVLGHLIGYKGIKIVFGSRDPEFLPRNIGIFGTVGSGKTNTAQVIIEEAVKNGWCVFVLDVEGEYTFMDSPNDDDLMIRILGSIYGLEPEGISDFIVYVPRGRKSVRADAKSFGVDFDSINPYVFSEIIDATEAQQRYLGKIVDSLKERERFEKGDEFEDKILGSSSRNRVTLKDVLDEIEGMINNIDRFMRPSLMALSSKFERLQKLGFIDVGDAIDLKERIKPGALTIIDLSDAEDRVKNIVIAWLLDSIFMLKLTGISTRTLIVIEEAHTFVSTEVREKMSATLDMLKVVARRGRKRWLSLVFVSQQPGHLPAEIFELCNTRIIHSLKSEMNLRSIRRTSGGMTSEYLSLIPSFSPGEAVICSPVLQYPLLIKVRPAKTKKVRFV